MHRIRSDSALPIRAGARQISRVLLTCILLLVFAYTALLVSKHAFGHGRLHGLGPLVDLDEEDNFPSFYSSMTLELSAVLLFLHGKQEQASGGRFTVHWYSLAALFTFLSFDEMDAIHEKITEPMRSLLHTSGTLYYAWVIPYGVAVIIIGLIYLPFLFKLNRRTRLGFIVAGVVYIGGAVGFEMIGAAEFERSLQRTLTYDMLVLVEESLEMFGIYLFIRILLDELARRGCRIKFLSDAGIRETEDVFDEPGVGMQEP